MTLEHYYNKDKQHGYMEPEGYDVIIEEYVKSLALKDKTVLEIGSGYGRYTNCLAPFAGKIIAAEPNSHMFGLCESNLKKYGNVFCINKDLPALLEEKFESRIDYIFLFHTLHHLPGKEYEDLRKLAEKLKAGLIIVEPNHMNPLFFIQVLITPDMTFRDEKGMFKDNSKILAEKYFAGGFTAERFYFGFLPRGLSNRLTPKYLSFRVLALLQTRFANPFSAYSVLVLKPVP